ncbi:hypothetical protein NIES593_06410 [Hydrococcus rivularis NIES-593]|uniref:Uncharacterized protein n=2 Tax=Hydrococcus TaxID=1616833 RepID=A0A1U7HMR2_9CYAN|nr:hypothetical protein NIES593_06410 [Hydrococcus rivularis NIES-593]
MIGDRERMFLYPSDRQFLLAIAGHSCVPTDLKIGKSWVRAIFLLCLLDFGHRRELYRKR